MDGALFTTSISVECVIVRLLGPVEVAGPRGRAMLSGRQRAMVGLLALQAGNVVLPARIVDAFWGEDPPRTAIKSLHSHIARIRQAMVQCGLNDVLLTRGTGYLLDVGRGEVDVCRFEDLVRSARDDLAQGRWVPAVDRLREALALWQGDPVQDGELAGWGLAEVARLQEVRLTALEDLWDAELRLGHHAAVAGELDRLLVQHPLRERLVELQMLALVRTGRRLDALEAYQRLRARLAQELGVDPAHGLQRLHTAILRHDPDLASGMQEVADPPIPRPAQLPPRVGHFTGRTKEMKELDRVLDGESDTHVVVVSGRGGMGKTALAIQWAHQVKDRFPDGQLFLDLRAMMPADALGQMLRSLGVPGDKVPSEIAEMINLYRSMLDGKRVLIILDNASTVDQIRPLVPATTTSALIVTARRPMTALATYHAVGALFLDALDDSDALALLGSVVGFDRVDREPAEAATIVNVCGRMPLALRIAAAKLAGLPGRGPGALGALAAELSGDRPLDALSVDGDSRSVRTVFASAYRTLSAPAARMFRLLSLHPGTTFVPGAATAISGLPTAEAAGALNELADAYLVAETPGGRYRFHDLIQLYATECARREQHDEAAQDRLLDWYLGVADAGNRTLDSRRDRVKPALRHPLGAVPFAANPQDVLSFFDGERENLPAVVRFAADHGRFDAAWQLTYLLTGFFDSRGQGADRVEICELGLAAAQRQGDPTAESLMRAALGAAYILGRRFDDALDCLYGALDLARAGGDRRREAFLANSIATAYAGLRSYDEALDAYLQALEVHRENDDRLGIAVTLNNIGTARIRLGQPALSFEHLQPALRLSREIENPRIEAWILCSLGEAYLRQSQLGEAYLRQSQLGEEHLRQHHLGEALEHFERALEIRRTIGDRRREVDTLNHIGVTLLSQGQPDAAVEHTRLALALSQELADPHLISICLTHLAAAQTRQGELDAARLNLKRALALRARVPDFFEEAAIQRALADHADVAGRPDAADEHREQAARLFLKANAPAEAAALTTSVTGT